MRRPAHAARNIGGMTPADSEASADEPLHEPRLWRDNGWTARVIKNEDDEGWAVEMVKDGEAEPDRKSVV